MSTALVTIQFRIPNLGDEDVPEMSFDELVKFLISEEGLFGIADDEFQILKIEKE